MISIQQLRRISNTTGLSLHQQEKDYCLKLFLYMYFRTHSDAIFKGGTCLRYLFGFDRFSEDLDFNLTASPRTFESAVRMILKELSLVGLASTLSREERFADAYTCDIRFEGPLYKGTAQTANSIRIDAGRRTGTLREPVWRLISSEYPETREQFLVLAMSEEEMLVEKIIAMIERRKGRDLYDVWFMLVKGVKVDRDLFLEKSNKEFRIDLIAGREEYERDLKRLTPRMIPYDQVLHRITSDLSMLER